MSNDLSVQVIVVEDEKLIAKNIAKRIEQCNPHFKVVQIFSNGEDAWDYIEKQPPHVVFTDIHMPIMNGIELAERIHNSKSFIHCVILTGYADFTYAQSALRFGVQDYLLKPINTEELNETLAKLERAILTSNEELTASSQEMNYSPEEIVSLVKEYVKKHYSEDINLMNISQNLGFSSSYLTKIFNKVEGTSPSKYIRDYRMSIAKQLMNDPELSINQICASVGYPDPFHFSKTFKQTFGISPSEYRRNN